MATRIYVGGLPLSADESVLENLFSPYGRVTSVLVATDQGTGHSKGYGFVEMSNDDAAVAISAVNGTEMNGHTLIVREAKPGEE